MNASRPTPSGNLRSHADPRPEPWEVVADAEERASPSVPKWARREEACVLVGFTTTWTAEVTRYQPPGVCPGCEDQPLRASEVCVVCSRTRTARTAWPMQATATRRERRRRELEGGK